MIGSWRCGQTHQRIDLKRLARDPDRCSARLQTTAPMQLRPRYIACHGVRQGWVTVARRRPRIELDRENGSTVRK